MTPLILRGGDASPAIAPSNEMTTRRDQCNSPRLAAQLGADAKAELAGSRACTPHGGAKPTRPPIFNVVIIQGLGRLRGSSSPQSPYGRASILV